MLTRYRVGSSAELNALNQDGGLAIDTERKALRFYSGGVQGGFEVLGEAALSLPGPQELITGTEEAGFYGEVPAGELIDGVSLASLIGLSAGTAFNNNEPWLKFASEGRTLYVAKKPLRYNLSWPHINAVGAVFGTMVELGGLQYRVRLLTGGDGNPAHRAGGEWNDLIYPIHMDDSTGRNWTSYTNGDLGVADDPSGSGSWQLGRTSWCQETRPSNSAQRVGRGNASFSHFNYYPSSPAGTHHGWRPVLEYQPPST